MASKGTLIVTAGLMVTAGVVTTVVTLLCLPSMQGVKVYIKRVFLSYDEAL